MPSIDDRWGHGGDDPLGDLDGLGRLGASGDEHHELVPTQPGDGVFGADERLDSFGHGHEQPVPGAVAHAVVDHLEAIEVDEEHDGTPARPGKGQDGLAEAVGEEYPVGKTGQCVVARLVSEGELGFLALGDVLGADQDPADLLEIGQVLEGHVDPAPCAVLALHEELVTSGSFGGGEHPLDDGGGPGQEVRMDEVRREGSHELVGSVAEQVEAGRADVGSLGIRGEDHDGVGRQLDHGLEPPGDAVPMLPLLLEVLAVADVPDEHDEERPVTDDDLGERTFDGELAAVRDGASPAAPGSRQRRHRSIPTRTTSDSPGGTATRRSGISRLIDWPTISSAEKPNAVSAAWLTMDHPQLVVDHDEGIGRVAQERFKEDLGRKPGPLGDVGDLHWRDPSVCLSTRIRPT